MFRDTAAHPTLLSRAHTAAEYMGDTTIAIALLFSLATIISLEQFLEDVTLMMFLEADGKDPFKWQHYLETGEVKILPSPPPGYPGYPDIVRYDIIYPGL